MNKSFISFSLVLALSLVATETSLSEAIYKKTNPDGKIEYSSKAHTPQHMPAKLPEIMRGEVKLPANSQVTCDKHGGVNCEAGADTDGSVICYDGFKDVLQRFKLTCLAPKLEIVSISKNEEDQGFTVTLRNLKQAEAKQVLVTAKTIQGSTIQLDGPTQVTLLGSADYKYLPHKHRDSDFFDLPKTSQINVTCFNC
jgi:hypothetical protein